MDDSPQRTTGEQAEASVSGRLRAISRENRRKSRGHVSRLAVVSAVLFAAIAVLIVVLVGRRHEAVPPPVPTPEEAQEHMRGLMAGMQRDNGKILRILKNAQTFDQLRAEIDAPAESLIALANEAKAGLAPGLVGAQPGPGWTALLNGMIQDAQTLRDGVADPSGDYQEARRAFFAMTARCASCHRAYRAP